jgi:hypothetical protein
MAANTIMVIDDQEIEILTDPYQAKIGSYGEYAQADPDKYIFGLYVPNHEPTPVQDVYPDRLVSFKVFVFEKAFYRDGQGPIKFLWKRIS